MTGLLRDSRTVEVDDETLTALIRKGSTCYVRDCRGDLFIGEIVHDGTCLVIRLAEDASTERTRIVEVHPREAPAQAGAQR